MWLKLGTSDDMWLKLGSVIKIIGYFSGILLSLLFLLSLLNFTTLPTWEAYYHHFTGKKTEIQAHEIHFHHPAVRGLSQNISPASLSDHTAWINYWKSVLAICLKKLRS